MALLKQTWAVMIVLSWSSAAIAGSCLPPAPPWMPTDPDDVRAYADLLKRDVEIYFGDVEQYFRCLDHERREIFEQASEVGKNYASALDAIDQ